MSHFKWEGVPVCRTTQPRPEELSTNIRKVSKCREKVPIVSISKADFSQRAENQVFLGVFLMVLAFFHSKINAKFDFGNFKP